jgi:uncharacterized protein (DUF58 family)
VLTRRGLLVTIAGLGLAVTGRLLGITELFATATAMLVVVVLACVYVRLSRYTIQANRQLRPPRVHAGGSSRVELTVTNTGTRRSPVLTIRDPFDGGRRWARFPLAPIAPGELARAAYRLPTDDRGIFSLGPLETVVEDPFGLATHSRKAAGSTVLTVYPRVDVVAPLPNTTGPDPTASTAHPNALTLTGEDFYALREYQVGDDLRRVHWPSTAKLDEIMIRQEELPWQGRATVLVDLRRQVHTGDSFEIAVSAAASIANASYRGGAMVRLASTAGFDSDFGLGQAHLDIVFEHLAAAVPHSGVSELAGALGLLRRSGESGAAAVITTSRTPATDLQALSRLRASYGAVVLVIIEAGTTEGAIRLDRPSPWLATGPVVRVGSEGSFASAWNHTIIGPGAARNRGFRARVNRP